MSGTRQMLILYPQTPSTEDEALAVALRQSGAPVKELVIGQDYAAVLDALVGDALPVVVK